jgi:hypothetical protein
MLVVQIAFKDKGAALAAEDNIHDGVDGGGIIPYTPHYFLRSCISLLELSEHQS